MTPNGDVPYSLPAAGGVTFPSWQQPGEQVLWTGRPDPRVVIPGTAVAGIVIGTIFLGLGLLWEHLLSQVSAPAGPYEALGLVPVLAGAWLVIGRPVRDARARRQTTYVITDRRAVIMTANRMIDTPLLDQPATIRRTRSGRVFADIGTPVPHSHTTPGAPGADGMPGPSSTTVRYVAPVTFRLVADGDAMLAALGKARSAERRPQYP